MTDLKNGSGRIEWIDTAKGIGLLLVILGHLKVPYMATWIYSFHMPLFFFLSGAVYSGQKYSFKEYLVKRLKSLVIPYFTFGVIIWAFFAVVNIFVSPESRMYGSNLEMIKGLFVQEHFWTIWFLAALFLVEILYYLLDKAFKGNSILLTLVSGALCIFGLLRYRLGWGPLPWNLDIAFVAQFFFHAGRVFIKNKFALRIINAKLKFKILVMFLLFAINAISMFLCMRLSGQTLDMSVGLYGNELLTFISAFSGIVLVVILSSLIKFRFTTYLGKNTMVIFALHSRVIIVLCQYIYGAIGIFQSNTILSQTLYACVTFVVILAVLIPVTELVKKTKIRFLFGV